MKNIVLLFAVLFSLNLVAQESNKNLYSLKGDLIEATIYHNNGIIAQSGFYTKENKLQGEWISYDTNGNKNAVAQYNNGEKVGTWIFFQGNTQKEVVYSDSKIAQVRTWEVTDTRVVSNRP